MVSATVLEQRGPHMFTLEAGGQRFVVQSELPLQRGDKIQVQVLQTTPVLELKRVAPTLSLQVRQGLALAGEIVDVAPLLDSLRNTFFAPVTPLQGPSGGSRIVALEALLRLVQGPSSALQAMDSAALEQLPRQGNYGVSATIMEHHQNGDTLVRIEGASYRLSGPLRGALGDQKRLQLETITPQLSFVALGADGTLDRSQPLLLASPNQALPALFRALQLPLFTGLDLLQAPQQQLLDGLQELSPGNLRGTDAGELLKRRLSQLGLASESLVGQGRAREAATQLKSLLAGIMRVFHGQEDIRSKAGHLLATLEHSQMIQANLTSEQPLLFSLPLSFLEKGYLLIEREQGQQEGQAPGDEDLSCTLHMTLEGLGNVRVRCSQGQGAVRIAFFLESEQKAQFVARFGGQLKESITSVPLLSLSFASGAESPGTALLQKILRPEQTILETRA